MSRWRRRLHRRQRLAEARKAAPAPALSGWCICTFQLRQRKEVRLIDRRCPEHGDRGHLAAVPQIRVSQTLTSLGAPILPKTKPWLR